MRKMLIPLFLLPFCVFAQSHDDLGKSWIVKTNPFSVVSVLPQYDYFTLTIEKNLDRKHAVQAEFLYSFTAYVNEHDLDYLSEYYISFTPQYKYFLGKTQKKWFTGGFLEYTFFRYNGEATRHTGDIFRLNYLRRYLVLGPLIGYQNYVRERFAYEFFIGGGYRQTLSTSIFEAVNTAGSIRIPDQKLQFIIGLNLGYRFVLSKG